MKECIGMNGCYEFCRGAYSLYGYCDEVMNETKVDGMECPLSICGNSDGFCFRRLKCKHCACDDDGFAFNNLEPYPWSLETENNP